MIKNRGFVAILLLSVLMSACGPATIIPPDIQPLPSPSDTQPSSAGSWDVSLAQTGGFAGLNLKVDISSDGRLTAEDVRSGKKATRDLDAASLAKLSTLVASAAALAPESPQRSSCADCFLYDLQVTSGGRSVHVQADDTTLGPSGMRELVSLLQQLRDVALKSQP